MISKDGLEDGSFRFDTPEKSNKVSREELIEAIELAHKIMVRECTQEDRVKFYEIYKRLKLDEIEEKDFKYGTKLFYCRECGKSFYDEDSLKQHIDAKHGGKLPNKYSCVEILIQNKD